jgi:hypothetical protein
MRPGYGALKGLIGAVTVVLVAMFPGVAGAATTTWTNQTVPESLTSSGEMTGVSCPTPTDCVVAPDETDSSGPLIGQWNGSTWSAMVFPGSWPAGDYTIGAVSCASADACAVVGTSFIGPAGQAALSEWWNGSTWTRETFRTPYKFIPKAVSCSSAANCLAVGGSLAEHWNGRTWTLEHPAVPPRGKFVELTAVSCRTSVDCVAVGGFSVAPYEGVVPLAEGWNGRTWTIQDDTLPAGIASYFPQSVSCPSAATCFAAGLTTVAIDDTAVVMRSQGGVWSSPLAVPHHGRQDVLDGISCVRVGILDHCTAVGYYSYEPDGPYHAMAVYYNGQRWVDQTTAAPVPNRTLIAVSCLAHGACTAVGSYYDHGTNASYLAEQN